MGKVVLLDAYIEVDTVDLSDHFRSITINSAKDEVDVTGFGASSKEIKLGLGDGTFSGTLHQDFDAASVDETLWPIHSAGDECSVIVRPTSDVVGPTNPQYAMTAVIPEYSPLDGEVGAASTLDIAFRNASQAGIVRTTA